MKRRILNAKTQTVVKRPKASIWRNVNRLTPTEMRVATSNPTRSTLTTNQFTEWACGVRAVKHYGFLNAESLSLKEMREVLMSVSRCSSLIALHQLQAQF